jgi:iron(II)-dependent oxidoreductase
MTFRHIAPDTGGLAALVSQKVTCPALAGGSLPMPSILRTPRSWQQQDQGAFVVHADPVREAPIAFALSVAAGLDDQPRWLDSRYLYDDAGSALFEQITRQPEYYQTRTEDRLLAGHARAIRDAVGDATLVELGAGSAEKTRRLLDAWTERGPAHYVPIDVSAAPLHEACAQLCRRYPTLTVEAIAACYERALPVLAQASPMVLTFLGSSLGNLGRYEQDDFLALIAGYLAPGDFFLVGLDFAKDAAVLEAAYDDAAGVTAAFTRNLFVRMNRELQADIPVEAVRHVAHYNRALERIEIYAELAREATIALPALGRTFTLGRGERIRTELAYKYRPQAAATSIERHGFRLVWTGADEDAGFGLFLFRRLPAGAPARGARRAVWQSLLDRVRARTLELVAPLGDEALTQQHSRLMSPLVWDLGHIAQFEGQWLLRALDVEAPRPELDAVYDPQRTPRAERDRLPIPPLAETRRYMDEVRRRIGPQLEAIDRGSVRGPLGAEGMVVQLVAQHEAQHQETMLQAIALREDFPYEPPFLERRGPAPAVGPAKRMALVPAGPFLMGTDDRVTAYDNERPVHQVDLPAFRLDVTPVTNGAYLAFMNDGGYRRRALWTDEGWRWRESQAAHAPLHWRPDGDQWRAMVFGRPVPIDPDCPVVHVSWFEADAYARWAGKRLPTEAEWEKAAAWDPGRHHSRRHPWGDRPAEAELANLDQRRLAPAPVGSYPKGRSPYGCLQMLGDVWEWTDSWFAGYPGFEAFPYREYSEIFFGRTYRVLRGGSFATTALVARNTFRNWDFPERRQIFAGFRCAETVGA